MEQGIQAARTIFGKCYFDAEKCETVRENLCSCSSKGNAVRSFRIIGDNFGIGIVCIERRGKFSEIEISWRFVFGIVCLSNLEELLSCASMQC